MKLHLPTRLRAAVLACFAVVSSFTTTLATGALAGGAFVVTATALVAPQAEGAAFDSITYGGDFWISDYRYSFILDDVGSNGTVVAAYWGGSATGNNGANGLKVTDNGDGTYSVALDNCKLNNTAIDATTTLTSNRGTTFNGLVLKTGVVYTVTANGIVGGNNGAKATITDVASGTATESGTYNSNMNGNQNPPSNKVNDAYAVNGSTALVWTGDMAAWKNTSGEVTALSADKVLYFDASESVSKTADVGGDVSVAGMKLYDNYTINATAAANIAAANGVTVVGDKTMTLSAAGSNTSTNTVSADFSGGLAVSSGTWVLSGAVNARSLAVNGGALTLSGAVNARSLAVNGGVLTLSGAVNLSGMNFAAADGDTVGVSAGAALTFADSAAINLGNLAADTAYKIFDLASGASLNGWDSLTAENFIVNGAALNSTVYGVTLTNGTFMYSMLVSDLTWNGGASGVWDFSTACWTTGDSDSVFGNDVNVIFNNTASVEVQGAINAEKMTVTSGNTLTLSSNETGSVSVKDLDIQGSLQSSVGIAVSGGVTMADTASWTLSSGAAQVLTEAQFANVKNMEIQNGASLALNSITTGQNGTVNASQLSGAGNVILKLRGNNGVNFNLSNFAGNIRVEKADGEDSARLQVNGSTFHANSTITLQSNGDLVFTGSGTVLSNDVSAEGVTKFFVNDGKSATINSALSGAGTITKTATGTLTLNGTVTVSEFISEAGTTNISGGSVTTLKTTGGTVNVNGGVVTSLSVRGGTTNLGDASGTHIWVGGRATVNVIGDYTASQLRMSEENTSTVNIKDGGSLTITGSENGINTSRTILIAHWNYASTLLLEGGSMTSEDAVLFTSWSGTGTFKATGGTANLKGISFLAQSNNVKGKFHLGTETTGTAQVNIGSEGIAYVSGNNVDVKLGNGTLGAISDWTMGFASGATSANVQLIGAEGGTVFDTMGHTVTVNTTLSGNGKLVKKGEGTLNLTGTLTCTGSIVAKAGTLSISSTGTNMIGAMEIDAGAVVSVVNPSLTAPIVNKGSLTLTGTLSVADLIAFTPSGTVFYVDASGNSAVSGYMAGERVYTLIENTGTLNDSGITSAKGVYANGKLTVSTVDDTVFYVNTNPSTGLPDEVTAVNLGAGRKYSMNGGYLTIDSSVIDASAEGDEVAGILLGTVGDEGRMVLTAATTLGNNSTTLAGCELEVSGVQLTLGTGEGQNVNLSSFDKVVLNDGGKIQYQATGNSTFNNLTVESGVGEFYSKDTASGIIQFDGVTTVGEYTVTEDGVETRLPATLKFAANWNTGMLVKQLSGAGNVEVYSCDNGQVDDIFNLTIDSLSGFTGKLSFTKDTGAPFNQLTVNTGTAAVSMKGVSAASTGGSHAALALILNVQGNTTLSEGLLLSNTEGGNGVTVTANIGTGASLTSDLAVTGSNNTFNLNGGNLRGGIRLNDNAALSTALTATGNLVVGNNATLNVAAAQTVTVAGVTELGETSALTKEGAGELNMGTSATLDSLNITGGTVRFQSGTIGNMMVTGGVAHIAGATSTVGSDGTFSSSHNNGFYIKGTGEVNIGDGTNQCVVTATRVEMGDDSTGSGGTLNVKSGSRLIVESPDVINHGAPAQDTYHKTGFILGEWGVSSTVNVEGVLLLKEASVTCGDNTGYVNVKNGGVLAAKGFLNAKDNDGTLVLGMEDGGKLILGDAGITAKTITATLGAGTVGIMADSLISKNVTLGSTAGTTFNTAKYVWTSDGANISEGAEGGTLTVSGVLSGSGKLVKTGAGTLKLTATNTYGGGTNLTGGTLEIAAESALGSGALSIIGGTLDVTGNVTLGSTVSTTASGGSLKASHADGWTLTGASVGGAAVSTDSVDKVTLTDTTITGNIIGNDKLVLAGTVGTTAASTVSAASVGGITLTATEANKLTLNNTTIGSAITNTNNGALVLSGTQNVTLDGANTTHYADVYGSSTFGANGYKSLQDVYTLVSGANATVASDTIWQIDGTTVADSDLTDISFDGKTLTVIQNGDTAGKVYYINSGSVEYKVGAGCSAAEKLQLVGGKLVMSKELDTAVTTGGIAVTGSSTTLELKTELAANKLSMGTGAATVLMGDGTLNLGTDTSLASGISLGTETDAKWTGTVKMIGAALSDANLGALGISGSTIELDDTDGSLKGGTYAAAVLLSNGSELTLGADNAFNGGLDATNGSVKIAGKNSISTLTLADSATLGIDFTSMGLDSLLNMGDEALLTIGTLNAGTAGGALNLSALISSDLLLTMSNGQSITLADITTNNATLGLLLDSGNGTPAESLVMNDDNGYQYTYTLAQDDTTGHTVVKVSAKLYQNGWIGDETDVWTTTDSLAGADANWEGSIGLFAGYGSGTVNIDAAGVDASAKTVMVSAAEHTTDYTFEGGALVANKLVVNAGSLTINNEGVETQETVMVSGEGSLTVNTGKELTVGTDMAVLNEAKFTNKGETTIIGTLGVAKDATVTNSRNLSVGGVSAESATISSSGQLTVGDAGGTIGALTGNGYLNNSGELTIKSDTDLQALTNAGTLTVEGALKVTATATGGVIKAASADLGYAKLAELQVAGAVTAKELTVDKATMESLTADKLASLAGDTVTVTNDASLGTFSVNGVLEVGGKLTVSDAVESEGEILAAEADLQSDATLDTLKVTGGLKATNLSVTTLEAASLDAESLTITDGGTGIVQSGVTLDKFSGSGSFTVLGDLTVNSSVAQGGTVQADNITVAGSAVFADVTTGSLTADAVSLTNGSITTLNTEHLTVQGTVSVTDDMSLASLGGTGTLQVDNKLSLTEQITSSANVAAGILELQASGSTLGSVLADTLAVAEGLTLSTTDALLTVDAFDVLNASEVAISLSESVFAALDKEASGLYSIADYLIIDGVASADIFNLTDCAGLDALRAAGRDATLSVSKGNLYLSITAAMDEEGEEIGLVWDATGGNTTTSTGSEIDTEDGFYKALDYVQQVLVKDDTTFDLTTDAVGDAEPGNTSKPELGLTVRNLRGGGELTIKGNSAAQDVASLFNTDGKVTSAAEAVGLTVDAARVNLGLPADSDGIMDDDFGAESPTLASLSLVNGAMVDVNADTEVLGDTDLADTSALQVAEGSILTTHMLSGTDKASVSGAIRVTKGGVYTGSGENAEIIASGGSDLRLRTGGRKGMSLLAENGSKVTLDSAGQDGSMKSLRVGGASMARMAGASTLNLLNTTTTDKGIVHNTLSLTDTEGNYISNTAVTLSLGLTETARTLGTADTPVVIDGAADVTGSSITVNMLGNGVKNGVLDIATGDVANLKLAQLVTGGTVDGNSVVLTGTPEMQTLLAKYYTNARLEKDGAITVDRVTDYYSANLKLSENAQTGAAMADVALLQVNPQANPDKYKDLAGVLDSLDDAVVAGNNAAADSLGAAVSGASVAALGAAVAGDVERQLMALRNRTTTMGVDQNSPNLDMPYFNAWINAEGDFRRMDEDGTAAGYELNSWGGTVGFDVDMTPNFTVGLAATAMYGDFTAKSADHAEGDMDTYYLTTFARFAAHRWSHTFVATVGMADTSLKRTVAHANGSYSAEGDTDALSFGFLYEVGYVAVMNESATACLQPVFNVMLSHSCLNGYKETGSDAALSTGDVEMTTVTFGLGARTQAQVGTGTLNRTTLLEGRALVKLRAGDREAESENALGLIPGATGSVVGAEKGVVGMELGVGITIPVGSESGSVFADASLEVGGGYTNINGTVGYRINF